ncbi:MAG: ABC transporter ATP-binding protein [Pseudomonadota bacterium]
MSNLLEVRDLAIDFTVPGGVHEAVKGVSFRIQPGSTVALVGESGSGKSVISQAIMGILPKVGMISRGQILFDDRDTKAPAIDLVGLDPEGKQYRDIRGGRISIIFQEPMTSLSALHTVGNQIIEALRLHRKIDAKGAGEVAEAMLAQVGFPNPARALKTYPFELSGGLRQRAMIAMALVCRPALLIADEPTTALDVTIQARILKLLKDLQAELGMAILIITHDLGVVANMADEIVVMYRGRVLESGERDDIFAKPSHPYLRALLNAVPRFDMKDGERLQPIREIKSKEGGLLAAKQAWPEGADAAGPLLSVEHVSKTYQIKKSGFGEARKVLAVNDVSFEVRRGECLGLVGESGCGKTTLSKLLMRALSTDTGSISFNDRGNIVDLLNLNQRALKEFRPRMQFMFQDPFSSLNPRMTVLDIITEPLIIHDVGDRAFRREMAKELMGVVGLEVRHLQRYPHSFSGGQRQRIGIARALALRPDLLICDEPVSALDVSIQAQVLNLLKDLKTKLGLTYLFISHNLAVVDYIADRIMVMSHGSIVETAPKDILFRDPVHPYTRGLLAAVPHPDPDHPLDLAHIMDETQSEPSGWPGPFRLTEGQTADMVDLGNGHFVRVQKDARPADIRNWELAS